MKTARQMKLYQSSCEYCCNAQLKLDVVNRLCDKHQLKDLKITDKNKLMDITMCNKLQEEDLPPKQCIIRECDACGVGKLINHLQPLIDRATDEILTWQYWTNTQYNAPGKKQATRKILDIRTGPVIQLIKDLQQDAQSLSKHFMTATWQKNCFDNVSKTVPADSVVMHLDFSENYSTFYQQEISSAHWMKNLITVHPFVVFYKCPDCGDGAKPVSDVLVFLTDDTQHDHHAVQEFMTKALKFLKEDRDVPFSKVYEYTDGCSV